ncbi:MAG: MFS transporter [Actinomycetota bacterium]
MASDDAALQIFGPQRRGLTTAIMACVGIIAYNNLAVSAALPEIGADLGDVALLPWTISAELLTSGVAILIAGPLVDGLGPRRIFRWSVTGFVLTSIGCGIAPSMVTLVAARAAQGIAAGLLFTVTMAVIGLAYESHARARVFAANSIVWGVMSIAGPSVAAVMVAVIDWRGVFFFNVPVAMIAAVLAWQRLPSQPENDTENRRIDTRGVALVTLVSAAGLAIVEGSVLAVVIGGTVSLAALIGYIIHARSVPDPVVRIAHVWSERYRSIHTTSMLAVGGSLGFHAFIPVYLRAARGASATEAAFSVIYLSIGWTTGAVASSRLQRRLGSEPVVLLGALFLAPGFYGVAISVLTDGPLSLMYLSLIIAGMGVGTISTTGTNVLQTRSPASEMGRVSAAHQFIRTLFITYGVGIAGALIFTTVDRRTGDVEAVRDLLGDDETEVSSTVADALSTGFGYTMIVACIAATLTVPSAMRLVRTRTEAVTSAA